MLTWQTCSSAALRPQRSQRDAAWHEPIYNIRRLFLQKLVENELSNLIDNLDFRSESHNFMLVHVAPVFPCSDITLRVVSSKSALRVIYQLGRLREGTWLRKSVPKLQEIDFQENFREIRIFMKIDIFRAHPTDLSLSSVPATKKPERCRVA